MAAPVTAVPNTTDPAFDTNELPGMALMSELARAFGSSRVGVELA